VLFCDLVGFTARSDKADPEDVGAMLRPYHVRLRAEIERLGGTLDKFIGDAVMAVFGAPVAHEDDPERAVRCALRMLAAIGELNLAHPALELAVRIGINTGEALVTLGPGEETEAVVGDVVNTASRLQGAAPVGGAVVGEATWQTTKALFDYQELESVRVKGKADPVLIWRVIAARSRLGVDIEQRPVTPFIGRQDELALLRRLYTRMVREHAAQLVTIIGEPGIGKSRLVREFFGFVDDRPELVAWRQGRCLAYGEGITFWALGEIVKAQAGVLESDDPEQAAIKLEAAVWALIDEAAEREWLKARLAPLLGLATSEGASVDRSESFAAWRRFIQAVAESNPLVLVVEDLHWADPTLLDFLHQLVNSSTEVDLVVIATARPDLLERHPGWGSGMRDATTVMLSPLDDEQTARLVMALLGQPVLSVDIQALLLERAGGNPLYAEEFMRLLDDRGLLVRHRRGIRLLPDADIPLPQALHALIAARLDMLPPDGKALIQDAAVAGRVFWSGALAAMGGIEEAAIRSQLEELQGTGFIRASQTSSVMGQVEYAFWHGLVKDVAYAQIPRAGRARRHRAAADWLRGLAGGRVADHAELIAHHYIQALKLLQAVGPMQEGMELEEPARRFLVLAGDRAINLDVARAESYYRQALELCPPDHPERATLLLTVAKAAQHAGRLVEAEQLCAEAIPRFRARGEFLKAGDALILLAQVFRNRGQIRQSRAALAEARPLLEAESRGGELASAYVQTTFDELVGGRLEEAVAWADRTLALAGDLGLGEQRAAALMHRGSARCELGDLDGLSDLREALDVALELGLGRRTASIANNLGEDLWLIESPTAALQTLEWGIEFAEQRGLEEVAIWIRASTLGPRFDLGDWDQVLRVADQVSSWVQTHGGSHLDVWAKVRQAQVMLYRDGRPMPALLAERFTSRAREIGDPEIVVPALTVAVLMERSRGNLAAAMRLVAELNQPAVDRSGWYRAQQLPDLVRVCIAANEFTVAHELIGRSPSSAARHRYSLLTARAVLAEGEGNLHEAARLYGEVVNCWTKYGHILEHGQALLGWGRCLLRLGQPEAGSRLQEARAVFVGLHARPLITESDACLTSLMA
jgi:class 3 adenylate cyclase/tetratricopeptide (TPR) repeat protein